MRIRFGTKLIGLSAVFGVVCSTVVSASTIIGAVGSTVTSTFGSAYDIGNVIDQSGLTAGYVSGADDFDAYMAGNPLHSQLATDNEWFSKSNVGAVTAVFDLGTVFSLSGLAIWNEESGGVPTADVSFSADGISFSFISTVLLTNNPQGAPYAADIFGFGAALARYVRLEMSGCPQASPHFSGCSLGEIAFRSDVPISPNPLPASLPLFASGAGIFGLWGWRKRRKSRVAC